MSTKRNNILLLITSELRYNRLLIILPAALLTLLYLVTFVSSTVFNIEKPIYFISPVFIIGGFAMGVWGNRIKEQRETFFTKLPAEKIERGLSRIIIYLIIFITLFLVYFVLASFLVTSSRILDSNPLSEMLFVLVLLGLSFIVQDFRYSIKYKYEKYWIPATLLLLVFLASPFIIIFIRTLYHAEQVVINNLLFAIYGVGLLSLSMFFYNTRTSFFD